MNLSNIEFQFVIRALSPQAYDAELFCKHFRVEYSKSQSVLKAYLYALLGQEKKLSANNLFALRKEQREAEDTNNINLVDAIDDSIGAQFDQIICGIDASQGLNQIVVRQALQKIVQNNVSLWRNILNISTIADSLLNGLEQLESPSGSQDIEQSRRIDKMVGAEYAYTDNADIFADRLARGKIRSNTKDDHKALGDLLIAVDTSGSTKAYNNAGISIIEYEMGLGIGLAKYCLRNNARAVIWLFNTVAYRQICIKKKADLNAKNLVEIYNSIQYGGTSFNSALSAICKFVDFGGYQTPPGLVLITDGEDSIKDTTELAIKQTKKRWQMKLSAYYIGEKPSNQQLDPLCNNIAYIPHEEQVSSQIQKFQQFTR
jgi:hypothetical protein